MAEIQLAFLFKQCCTEANAHLQIGQATISEAFEAPSISPCLPRSLHF